MALDSVRSLSVFSQEEIKKLFRRSTTAHRELGIEVRLAPQVLDAYGRILIIIPRTFGNAVKRNLMRRRIKSIFYQEKLFSLGNDAIVLVNKHAAHVTFNELKIILRKAFAHDRLSTHSVP